MPVGPGRPIRILQKWVEDILEGAGQQKSPDLQENKSLKNVQNCVLIFHYTAEQPPVVWTDLMGHFRLSRVSPRGPLTAVKKPLLGRRCCVLSILTLEMSTPSLLILTKKFG